jgi:acetyl-CoA carboxylase beta subunit
MGARERVRWLTDEDSFTETEAMLKTADRLGFPGYAES